MEVDLALSDKTEEQVDVVEKQPQQEAIPTVDEATENKTSEVSTDERFNPTDDLEDIDKKLEEQLEALKQEESDQKSNDVKSTKDEDKTLKDESKTDSKTTIAKEHQVKIDKDYISKQPEEQQEILKALLGKRDSMVSDSQLLKNYVNGQLKIKNDAATIEQLKTEKKVPDFSQEDLDQVSSLTKQLVEQEMKAKYPDMPDMANKDEFNYWKRELFESDDDKYFDFRNELKTLEKEFRAQAENEVHLANNWQFMAKNQTELEIEQFKEFVEAKNVSFNDLELNKDDAEFIKSILFIEGNKPNPSVVQMYNGKIPVVVNGSVLSHLKDRFLDRILELREIKIRGEAFDKKNKLKPNPQMSATNVPGKVDVKDKTPSRKMDQNEDLELIEEELLKQKAELGMRGTSII